MKSSDVRLRSARIAMNMTPMASACSATVRTGTAAWTRAVAIAEIAHKGLWESEAGDAVFFHARYVRPSWSRTKTQLAQIDTHIFYR